jgi:phosphohistidine phosphatase SixA
MMNRMITWPYGPILLLTAAVCAGQLDAFPEQDLIQRLQAGGHVLYIRHFQPNPNEADTDPLNLENVKAQRQLSDEGRKQATALGAVLRTLNIPVDRVVTSKFFRAYETGQLLRVGEVIPSIDISEGGLITSPLENQRRAKVLRQLLSEIPPEGKNRVIVSHRLNLQDAAGKEFGDTVEGEVVVFRPLPDGTFELVARVAPPEKWNTFVQ